MNESVSVASCLNAGGVLPLFKGSYFLLSIMNLCEIAFSKIPAVQSTLELHLDLNMATAFR